MNPNLFKSSEFYHRRYHNFATVLILPFAFFLTSLYPNYLFVYTKFLQSITILQLFHKKISYKPF